MPRRKAASLLAARKILLLTSHAGIKWNGRIPCTSRARARRLHVYRATEPGRQGARVHPPDGAADMDAQAVTLGGGLGHERTGLDKVHASLIFNRSLDPHTTEGVKRQMIIHSRMAQTAVLAAKGGAQPRQRFLLGKSMLGSRGPRRLGRTRGERTGEHDSSPSMWSVFFYLLCPWCGSTAPCWEVP